jgi:hypothetical protein
MKKSLFKNIIIWCFIAILLLFLLLLINKYQYEFVVHEFPSTLVVNNYTEFNRADTIAMVILNKVLGYDSLNVNIYESPLSINSWSVYIAGFIIKTPTPNTYNIFIDKNTKVSIKRLLAHELYHLHQYQTGVLKNIHEPNHLIVYKNDTINLKKVSYFDRTYEIDAIHNEYEILKKLNKLLHKRK